MSNVVAAHTLAIATAEKTLAYEQVDEVAEASSNYYDALTTADGQETTGRDSARSTWWTAEANAHADLRIGSATADHDWGVDILAADKVRITSENNAQKTLRDAQTNAYQTSETAWAQHDRTFYLAEIDKSATLSSGLSDPWSVRDDNLRAGRAPSDRNRLAASLTLTSAKITEQRDLVLSPAFSISIVPLPLLTPMVRSSLFILTIATTVAEQHVF